MTGKGDHWFRVKSHGYGATPTNWKGWAVVLGFVAIVGVLSHLMVVRPALAQTGPSAIQFLSFMALIVVGILVLIRITRAKSEGEWKWRWGGK